MKYYPDNTLAKFTTKLQAPLSLQGEWEVGLSEIIFPKNWFNVPTDQSIIIEIEPSEDPKDYPHRRPIDPDKFDDYYARVPLDIPKGYYKDVASLVDEINSAFKWAYDLIERDIDYAPYQRARLLRDGWVKLTLQPNTNIVHMSLFPLGSISMTDTLIALLGFNKDDFPLESNLGRRESLAAERIGDVDFDRHTMYIYCDLLECVPVGDTSAPLLRTLDVPAVHGTTVHKHFNQPRYVPLRKTSFETVEIDIRDAYGIPMPFESGTVIVTLHFRRVTTSYFLP
jgi:hypothetical protein